jgi:hypothetical protein
MHQVTAALLGLLLFFSLFLLAPPVQAQPLSSEVCLSCHSVPGLEKLRDGKSVSLQVDGETFAHSVHGPLGCATCHSDVSRVPHAAELKRVQCSACHTPVANDFLESVHGKAYEKRLPDAPGCSGCHGKHDILASKNPSSRVYPLNLPRTCGNCHGDPELAKRHNIPVTNAYQLYMDSIHGRALTKSGLLVAANCSSCHGSHRILQAMDLQSSVNRRNVPATCGQCHAGVLKIWEGSVHGKLAQSGNDKAPVCIDCHTSHEIRRVEMDAWKLEVVRECGNCHAESLRSYRDTFHGQVTALGFTRVARCSDCHGFHEILPVSEPGSSVAPARIVATCQKCHPSANASFAKYDPHADPKNKNRNPMLYYSSRFMTWLLGGVFVFFGVHTALWFGRALVEKKKQGRVQPPPDGPGADERSTPKGEGKDG